MQVKETLYFVLHYEKTEKVKIQCVQTVQRLQLVNDFYETMQMIVSATNGKLCDVTEEALILAGYFTGRGQEERRERLREERKKKATRLHLLIRPSVYDNRTDVEKSIVLRESLVQEREKESLLKQVQALCAKDKIISETTNMQYQELHI